MCNINNTHRFFISFTICVVLFTLVSCNVKNNTSPVDKATLTQSPQKSSEINIIKTSETPTPEEISLEQMFGVEISDTNEIELDCNGNISTITIFNEVSHIKNALEQTLIRPLNCIIDTEESIYEITLISQGNTLLFISLSSSFEWGLVDGIYFQILNPNIMSDVKEVVEKYDGSSSPKDDLDMHTLVEKISSKNLEDAYIFWSHFPLEKFRVEYIKEGAESLSEKWGTQKKKLSDNDIEYIINILVQTNFEILENPPISNTDFQLDLNYDDGSSIGLIADNQEVYIRIRYKHEWIHAKVLHIELFEYLLGFAGEGGFAIDRVSGTESITICYVKESDRKDYPENGKLTKIEISDSELVKKIAEEVWQRAVPSMTYPSRETADIIFHTHSGDLYGKIKFPISTDENGISEPTIIMQGYYWYSCEGLYNLLIEYEP